MQLEIYKEHRGCTPPCSDVTMQCINACNDTSYMLFYTIPSISCIFNTSKNTEFFCIYFLQSMHFPFNNWLYLEANWHIMILQILFCTSPNKQKIIKRACNHFNFFFPFFSKEHVTTLIVNIYNNIKTNATFFLLL